MTKRIIWVVALLLVVVAAYFAIIGAQVNAREQAVMSIRNSVIESAKQCCAVEGSYPSSLSHLEQHYGLTINHEDYVISYEWLGDNLVPSVVVTPR